MRMCNRTEVHSMLSTEFSLLYSGNNSTPNERAGRAAWELGSVPLFFSNLPPPFPSMSCRIKLLHEGKPHMAPLGQCADERLVNHPTHGAQLGSQRCGA